MTETKAYGYTRVKHLPIQPGSKDPVKVWEEIAKVVNSNSELRTIIDPDSPPEEPQMDPGELVWFKCTGLDLFYLVYYDYDIVNGQRVGSHKYYFTPASIDLY